MLVGGEVEEGKGVEKNPLRVPFRRVILKHSNNNKILLLLLLVALMLILLLVWLVVGLVLLVVMVLSHVPSIKYHKHKCCDRGNRFKTV